MFTHTHIYIYIYHAQLADDAVQFHVQAVSAVSAKVKTELITAHEYWDSQTNITM